MPQLDRFHASGTPTRSPGITMLSVWSPPLSPLVMSVLWSLEWAPASAPCILKVRVFLLSWGPPTPNSETLFLLSPQSKSTSDQYGSHQPRWQLCLPQKCSQFKLPHALSKIHTEFWILGTREMYNTFVVIFILVLGWGFPGGSDGKESACKAGNLGLIPWRRKWQPTPVFWRIPWTEEPGGLQSKGS